MLSRYSDMISPYSEMISRCSQLIYIYSTSFINKYINIHDLNIFSVDLILIHKFNHLFQDIFLGNKILNPRIKYVCCGINFYSVE